MKHDPMCPMTTPDGYLCCCGAHCCRTGRAMLGCVDCAAGGTQGLAGPCGGGCANGAGGREDEANSIYTGSYETHRIARNSGDEIIEAIDGLLHEDPCDCDTCMALTAARIELTAAQPRDGRDYSGERATA